MSSKKSMRKVFIPVICAVLIVAILFAVALKTSNAPYTSPSKDAPINACADGENKTVMALIADPQISFYSSDRYSVFRAASEDLHEAGDYLDAIVGVGDITENATFLDYKLVKAGLEGIDTRYIMVSGNHDIRFRLYKQSLSAFSDFANALNGDDSMKSYYFSEVINGYKVIVLGSEKTELEQAYISETQLAWLESEIEAENGKAVFVFCHQTLENTHNEKNAFGSITKAGGHVGKQSQAIQDILSKYKNVFFISGHLHSGFGPDSYNNVDGIHCINVPSMSIVNKDGTYNDAGTAYIMEVSEDEVVFRARDLAKGTWVADTTGDDSYDITVKLEK